MDLIDIKNDRIDRLSKALEKEMTISQNLFLMNVISIEKDQLQEFFDKQCIEHIAVYGLGKVGQAFVRLLKQNDMDVECVIDRDQNVNTKEYKTIHDVADMTEEVDTVIITSDYYFREIKEEIERYSSVRCILLHDLLEYSNN